MHEQMKARRREKKKKRRRGWTLEFLLLIHESWDWGGVDRGWLRNGASAAQCQGSSWPALNWVEPWGPLTLHSMSSLMFLLPRRTPSTLCTCFEDRVCFLQFSILGDCSTDGYYFFFFSQWMLDHKEENKHLEINNPLISGHRIIANVPISSVVLSMSTCVGSERKMALHFCKGIGKSGVLETPRLQKTA